MTKYTPQQQAIIDSRNKNLIVSASAGTGKTTVMVGRIVEKILKGELDLDNLLAVTFTKLATEDMKNKILSKLQSARQGKANKKEVQRAMEQSEKVDSCAVSTIHSFCADVVRNFFYLVDVDPNFSILEEANAMQLKVQALSITKEEFKDDEDFSRLYTLFLHKRKDETFDKSAMQIYDFSRAQVDFEKWWQAKKQNFQNLSSTSPLCQKTNAGLVSDINKAKIRFEGLANEFSSLQMDVCSQKAKENVVELSTINDLSLRENVQKLDSIAIKPMGNVPIKYKNFVGEQQFKDLKEKFKQVTEQARKVVQEYKDIFKEGFDKALKDVECSTILADKMIEFVLAFDKNFSQLKKQRGVVDFNDLERFALQIVNDNDALAELQSKYTEIFVDEYQDVNGVQEAIIEKLHCGTNLFMVGDYKQSIYDFRQCDPKYFAQKCKEYQIRPDSEAHYLTTNFRSNNEILKFVNVVFSHVMTADFGGVDYQGTSMLSSNIAQQSQHPAVMIDVVHCQQKEKELATKVYDVANADFVEEDDQHGRVIAERIKQLVGSFVQVGNDKKQIQYGDVVLLFRGMVSNEVVNVYNTLVKNNIPVSISLKEDEFSLKELKDLVNLLRVCDNPFDDVATTGLALSFLGGFDENTLSEVVLSSNKDLSLYEKIQQSNLPLAKSFVDFVNKCRLWTATQTIEKVLLNVIEQTNYHLYVQGLPNGQTRIKRLYETLDKIKGKEFSQSVTKFLNFVDFASQAKEPSATTSNGAVRIMTMHASKGLEFPVVFVCRAHGELSHSSKDGERFLLDKDWGIAFNKVDFEKRTIERLLSTKAIALDKKAKRYEEEMRLLYVALTRAQNHLIVVCNDKKQKWEDAPNAKTFADWIFGALKQKYGDIDGDKLLDGCISIKHWSLNTTVGVQQTNTLCAQTGDFDKAVQQMNYVYPHLESATLPMKVVSSRLDKLYSSEEDVPIFEPLQLTKDQLDASQLGTDYHKVFELIDVFDLDNLDKNVSELEDKQIILSKLDLDVIRKVAQNQQLKDLLASGKVYREQPFMLNIKAKEVIANCNLDDDVVLQGIVDVVIIKEETAIVLDYKYTKHPEYIKQNYGSQLNSYAMAVERICKVTSVEKYVMSIANNQLIKL